MVPTALEAWVTATQRVRSDSTASTALAGSSSVSPCGSAKRTVAPARSAWMTHGRTLASWSRRVQTISSPGASVRPTAPAKAIVSAVMLKPKTISPGGRAEQRAGARARGRDELVGGVRRREGAAVVGAATGSHPRVHRLDRRVDHLGARRPVEPRPAGGREPGEALAVHVICSAAESTSSLSWGYESTPTASAGESQRISSTSSFGSNSVALGLHQPVAHRLGAALAVVVGDRARARGRGGSAARPPPRPRAARPAPSPRPCRACPWAATSRRSGGGARRRSRRRPRRAARPRRRPP